MIPDVVHATAAGIGYASLLSLALIGLYAASCYARPRLREWWDLRQRRRAIDSLLHDVSRERRSLAGRDR